MATRPPALFVNSHYGIQYTQSAPFRQDGGQDSGMLVFRRLSKLRYRAYRQGKANIGLQVFILSAMGIGYRTTDTPAPNANISTRKLSYRKDDRAMRPIYGCPENFRESLTSTPTANL